MTEIREIGFSIDLAGEWERLESDQPGTFVYGEVGGSARVTVLLLSVRPVYAIADRRRLLSDYADHRSKFEQGQMPTLVQYEEDITEHEDSVEAVWSGEDSASAYKQHHRALLANDVLLDVCYSGVEPEQKAFDVRAAMALSSVKLGI